MKFEAEREEIGDMLRKFMRSYIPTWIIFDTRIISSFPYQLQVEDDTLAAK